MTRELFGLSGAGKSYYANSLSGIVIISDVPNKIKRLCLTFSFFLTQPLFFLKLLSVIFKEHSGSLRSLKRKVTYLAFERIAKYQMGRKNKDKDVLIDEGIVSLLLSIYDQKLTSAENLEWFSFKVPSDHTIIIIESSRKKRESRMRLRGRIPRMQFGENYYKKWRAVNEHNYPIIKKFLEDRYQVTVIEN